MRRTVASFWAVAELGRRELRRGGVPLPTRSPFLSSWSPGTMPPIPVGGAFLCCVSFNSASPQMKLDWDEKELGDRLVEVLRPLVGLHDEDELLGVRPGIVGGRELEVVLLGRHVGLHHHPLVPHDVVQEGLKPPPLPPLPPLPPPPPPAGRFTWRPAWLATS